MKLPAELKGAFDRIICDPPFLSEDCQTKGMSLATNPNWRGCNSRLTICVAALTVRFLAKSWTGAEALRLLVCTGERMESLITKLYSKVGTRTTSFEVVHAKGLSNEFRCYANFESEDWKWVEEK